MGQQWDADFELTAQDAAQLIEQQFPELAPAHLVLLGVGWDNIAFLVNERWVFRFPRRLIAAGLIEREARILPLLAPHLPLCISVPEYVGTPTASYPYVFAGYQILHGRPANEWHCSDDDRAALAPTLAHFLAALHRISLGDETRRWAPGDEIERTNLPKRAPRMKERLQANVAGLDASEVQTLIALVDELAATPAYANDACWVHGDFYGRHIVLDDAHQLAGVIDWGDVHAGDPALDLSIAFTFLPPAARPTFRQVYGPIDDATWKRARFRAIHYGIILTEYGAGIGDPSIHALGEYALISAPIGL